MTLIQLRRGPKATWLGDNPILDEGEIGVETDNAGSTTVPLAYKIGDGETGYTSLPYATAGSSTITSVFGRTTTAIVAQTGDYTVSQVTGAAPTASPALTGTPTAPTATAGTNTTQLATTAFVTASFAPLTSPALTGTPTAPTATTGTNTTQVATTAFVLANSTSVAPNDTNIDCGQAIGIGPYDGGASHGNTYVLSLIGGKSS